MQTDEGQDHPEHSQHLVRGFRNGETLGLDRLEPSGIRQAPTIAQRPLPATAPAHVAAVIAEGRTTHPKMALYLWLAAITGARRGELCALQFCDIDLERGILHLAFNYLVKKG